MRQSIIFPHSTLWKRSPHLIICSKKNFSCIDNSREKGYYDTQQGYYSPMAYYEMFVQYAGEDACCQMKTEEPASGQKKKPAESELKCKRMLS